MEIATLLGEKILPFLACAKVIAKKGTPGAVAELGVYKGGSLDLLAQIFVDRPVFGFDTFNGMPDAQAGEVHKKGDFADVSFEEMAVYFSENRKNVTLVRGFFPQTTSQIADQKYCFVHLDGDYYQSTKDGLEYFWPRLSGGGAILLDDYEWVACPGVKQAIDEFLPRCKHALGKKISENQFLILKEVNRR
jgi:O-methyltransferase